jgi:hypothetical protein
MDLKRGPAARVGNFNIPFEAQRHRGIEALKQAPYRSDRHVSFSAQARALLFS